MSGRDDQELLRDHIAGDSRAFGLLVERHGDRLWAVAVRTLGDPDEAADAVQDALISAFRKADTYRGEAAVTTWLHRIVVNACLDRLRRSHAGRERALPEADGHQEWLADPHDRHRAAEDRIDLAAAMARLSIDQRAAVVLVDLHGLPVAEAAEVLGVPVGTVKSRCSRGRLTLAGLLGNRQGMYGVESDVHTDHPAGRPIAGGEPR